MSGVAVGPADRQEGQRESTTTAAVLLPLLFCCCCCVLQELLHAARVMLPHLVRLLPACSASVSTAAETLEFITKHTHHPHYPPFTSTPSLGGSGGRGGGGGGGKGEAALLDAGVAAADQGCLLQVPRIMARLMGDRWI